MGNCGENKNPLKRGGTSQRDRLLDALKPGYIKVDEHDFQDWIVFANEFARFLNYFDDTNTPEGDWTPFFTSDISSLLGSIAIQDIDVYRDKIKTRLNFLKDDDNRLDTIGLETNLNELFGSILTLSKAMDEYQQKLPATITLKNTLLNLIQSKLAPALNRLISYYKEAVLAFPLATLPLDGDWRILNKKLVAAGDLINEGLTNAWIVKKTGTTYAGWSDYVSQIPGDLGIFVTPLADSSTLSEEEKIYLQIQHAANHNLFSGIFDQYLFAFTKIVEDAAEELKKTLTGWDDHQPHYALFLAFLKLFKYAQQQSNTITRRHLDFYYKEVLRLKPREALPNKANLLVELAKQVNSYLLAKGTELKGGKDSKGKDVLYALDNNSTFSKAKIASLKSVYIANDKDSIKNYDAVEPVMIQENTGRVFASPVANSEDGLGAELTSVNKEWHPYVHKEFREELLSAIVMPKATIGFAIASHNLYLTEGERNVFIKLYTHQGALLDNKQVECYLTTAKGWHKVTPSVAINGHSSPDFAQISFTIQGDKPPIENYNASVHGGLFNCALPVLKVYLIHNDLTGYEYNNLKDIAIDSVDILVSVGMDSTPNYNQKGLKNLLVSTDAGPVDTSKPFQPFGPQPKKDATFVIGNKEVFSKNNTAVSLNIEWANHPGNDSPLIDYEKQYNATLIPSPPPLHVVYTAGPAEGDYAPKVFINYLSSGIWNTVSPSVDFFRKIFTRTDFVIPTGIRDSFFEDYGEAYLPLNNKTNRGFIRFTLEKDFGIRDYFDDLTRYLIEQASPALLPLVPLKPVEPYTPVIKSMYLGYSAYERVFLRSIDQTAFDERKVRFYHIYPFGEAEQHRNLNSPNNNTDSVYLLPQFKHWKKNEPGETVPAYHSGEFYIGIENLEANQAVNILFQVVEGTTDPQVAKPPDHIKWSYLSNNYWIDFKDQEISDSTLALLQSGIISFAIPGNATTTNTLLSPGKIWIRAGIEKEAGAIPQLLSVDAQAAVCTFKPNDNADDFLNNPLAASTISKLKIPDAAIKRISQPYSSFGGRPKESEDHFYIRASERLRHKARAVTIWDYEHLILEEFPEIYRVKCLNHTGITEEAGKEYTNEMKPGHVLIITIPQLRNRESNVLKPYTSQDILTNIENFIKKKVSCFVTVNARQPIFEEIGISFSLKLHEQYKDFTFYSNMLKNEITQYLTPWAHNSNADIQFGGKIYKSALVNFIEERYYVDFITDAALTYKKDGVFIKDKIIEEITASTARSILVSRPASKHVIDPFVEKQSVISEECVLTEL